MKGHSNFYKLETIKLILINPLGSSQVRVGFFMRAPEQVLATLCDTNDLAIRELLGSEAAIQKLQSPLAQVGQKAFTVLKT